MLADAGIPLGSQTVLLKGVNDNSETMKELFHKLLQVRIKPYYLFQADMTLGTDHFRTDVQKGLDIIKDLQGFTSGMAVPYFVIDTPGGGGKVKVVVVLAPGRLHHGPRQAHPHVLHLQAVLRVRPVLWHALRRGPLAGAERRGEGHSRLQELLGHRAERGQGQGAHRLLPRALRQSG